MLGTAAAMGAPPNIQDLYDPSSKKHLLAGTFPKKANLQQALTDLEQVFLRYGVSVVRPDNVVDCNQIFARDLGFVVDDIFVRSNIIPHREKELAGLTSVLTQIPASKQLVFPKKVHIEGGDVIVHNDYIYVGISTSPDYAKLLTARTNKAAVAALQQAFPHKKVKGFELNKSNTIPHENALHLDCCFQLVGKNFALTCPEGFADREAYNWLVTHFGNDNIFEVSALEMSQMMCNVVSISPTVVVSDTLFTRLNTWLRNRGITVEEVDFSEIGKQGGLFRCVTLPLYRVL
ncbi:MAG: arginine deiminase family protein [Flavobacteriaceae bacterium]|jgi:N-dimethylarginine dimethylaminohydrolase|nr:arginine deiminase family protein [Flavobacteriaceae bacterium]MDG2289748.1 arginine deiminase family protein [Flavobacteriaceae bacterium]